MSPELLFAEGVGSNVGSLAYIHFADVSLIDIDANTQRLAVADRQDGIGDGRGIRDTLAATVMLAQYSAVNGRPDKSLVIAGLRLVELSLRQLEVGFRQRLIFFPGTVVDEGMLLHSSLVLSLGDVGLARVSFQFLTGHDSRREQLLAAV